MPADDVPAEPSYSTSSVHSPSAAPPSSSTSSSNSWPSPHRLLDFGRARHGEHYRVRRLSAAGIARCLSWLSLVGWVIGGGIDLSGTRLCAARGVPAGERRSLRLHAAGVPRSRGVPGRVGLLDLDLDRQRRAGGRLCRLSRPVHPVNRAQSGRRRVAGRRDGLALTAVNCRGTLGAGRVQVVTTTLKVLPLLLVGIAGATMFEPSHFSLTGVEGGIGKGVMATVTLTLWAFVGLESATVPGRAPPTPAARSARDGRRHAAGGRTLPAQHRRRHEPAGSREPGEVDRALRGRGSCAGRRWRGSARCHRRRDFLFRRPERLGPRRRSAADGGGPGRPVPSRLRTDHQAAARRCSPWSWARRSRRCSWR